MTEPKDILVWAQVGGQMVQIATTAFSNLKGMLAAAGADEAALNAALDRTHTLYQAAIAHELSIVDSAKRVVPLLLLTLLLSAPAFAQTAIPTDYTFESHFEATPTGVPISTFDFTKAAALCDQTKQAITGVQLNPRYLRFDDPANPTTRDCVFDTGATSGVLFAMPFGGRYVGVLVAKVVVGGLTLAASASDPSNPFVRGTPPARASGVRIGG